MGHVHLVLFHVLLVLQQAGRPKLPLVAAGQGSEKEENLQTLLKAQLGTDVMPMSTTFYWLTQVP